MTNYKPHFACFECRKTYKRRLLGDIRKGVKEATFAKCPQCSSLMADIGLDFESPRKNDIKSWEHIKNLYSVGMTFHSCGCSGPGYIPKDSHKILESLQKTLESYVDNMRFWLKAERPESKKDFQKFVRDNYKRFTYKQSTKKYSDFNLQKPIDYWTKKVKEIETHIEKINKTLN